jgi:hypothetical protein
MAAAATTRVQGQVRPRGVQAPHPPSPHAADLEGQVRDAHANRRMMHPMQLRSLAGSWRGRASDHAAGVR